MTDLACVLSTLAALSAAQPGIEQMKRTEPVPYVEQQARLLWWPGIESDLAAISAARPNAEQMQPIEPVPHLELQAKLPWMRPGIGSDFIAAGRCSTDAMAAIPVEPIPLPQPDPRRVPNEFTR
jgi:hypothetical protein